MDERVLGILEFDKILERLQAYAASNLAKQRIEALRPSDDPELLSLWQDETEAAVKLILRIGNPPLFGINEIQTACHRTTLGGSLSAGALLQIAETLRVSRALQDYVGELPSDRLVDEIKALFVHPGVEAAITDAIISEEEIADTASHKLFGLRRSMQAKEGQIRERINRIMTEAAKDGHLRESLVTVRAGRYVLPVKSESRSHVPGVLHDQSGSGATVFIEPIAIVNLNNEILQLQLEEQEEIRRILAALSEEVAAFAEPIAENQGKLVHLDFTFAKAKYALAIKGHRPIFTADRVIDLHQARHPLLTGEVVPIDIELGETFNTLVITGPNTGGKTVSLKTLGLMVVMAQSGLQIPAGEHSRIGIFSSVYADIGDAQSIEMSLSTFSASMTNIVRILSDADAQSLILFDELGAGTDPTEGAALAMAILQYLTDYDIRTVATTHYAELKLFAIEEPRVQNASVEFDVESLSPTYRLMIGLPGRSNAFEIARRIGLPKALLDEAQGYVDERSSHFEDVLADIESNRKRAEQERAEVERMRTDYEQRLKGMAQELARAEEKHRKQQEEAGRQAREMIDDAAAFAQTIIREAKKKAKQSTRELDRTLSDINIRTKEKRDHLLPNMPMPKREIHPAKDLKPGEAVRIVSMDQEGVIVTAPDKNGDAQVQIGILKVTVNHSDLMRIESAEPAIRASVKNSTLSRQKTLSISPSLDLRGVRYEAAVDAVDKYLDDALLAGLADVKIIHGKGTGALRKGITEFLRTDRRVASYKLADIKEGGAGVTVVELK